MTAVESAYWEAFWYLEPWETHVLDADEFSKRNMDPAVERRLLEKELRARFELKRATVQADG